MSAATVLTSRQVADRIFWSFLTLSFVGIRFFEPDSISYTVAFQDGWPATVIGALLATLACFALADVVINDCLPPRFTFHAGHNLRQWVWMLLAVMHSMQTFVLYQHGMSLWLAMPYVCTTLRCCVMSFLDLFYAYLPVQGDRRRAHAKATVGVADAQPH